MNDKNQCIAFNRFLLIFLFYFTTLVSISYSKANNTYNNSSKDTYQHLGDSLFHALTKLTETETSYSKGKTAIVNIELPHSNWIISEVVQYTEVFFLYLKKGNETHTCIELSPKRGNSYNQTELYTIQSCKNSKTPIQILSTITKAIASIEHNYRSIVQFETHSEKKMHSPTQRFDWKYKYPHLDEKIFKHMHFPLMQSEITMQQQNSSIKNILKVSLELAKAYFSDKKLKISISIICLILLLPALYFFESLILRIMNKSIILKQSENTNILPIIQYHKKPDGIVFAFLLIIILLLCFSSMGYDLSPTFDTNRNFLFAKQCLSIGYCNFKGATTSFMDLVNGSLVVHFLSIVLAVGISSKYIGIILIVINIIAILMLYIHFIKYLNIFTSFIICSLLPVISFNFILYHQITAPCFSLFAAIVFFIAVNKYIVKPGTKNAILIGLALTFALHTHSSFLVYYPLLSFIIGYHAKIRYLHIWIAILFNFLSYLVISYRALFNNIESLIKSPYGIILFISIIIAMSVGVALRQTNKAIIKNKPIISVWLLFSCSFTAVFLAFTILTNNENLLTHRNFIPILIPCAFIIGWLLENLLQKINSHVNNKLGTYGIKLFIVIVSIYFTCNIIPIRYTNLPNNLFDIPNVSLEEIHSLSNVLYNQMKSFRNIRRSTVFPNDNANLLKALSIFEPYKNQCQKSPVPQYFILQSNKEMNTSLQDELNFQIVPTHTNNSFAIVTLADLINWAQSSICWIEENQSKHHCLPLIKDQNTCIKDTFIDYSAINAPEVMNANSLFEKLLQQNITLTSIKVNFILNRSASTNNQFILVEPNWILKNNNVKHMRLSNGSTLIFTDLNTTLDEIELVRDLTVQDQTASWIKQIPVIFYLSHEQIKIIELFDHYHEFQEISYILN